MAKFTVEINVTDEQIQKAIAKTGKFEAWRIQRLAEQVVENKVKAKMRKAIGDIDELIDDAIEAIDWNKVVMDRIAERMTYSD